MSLLCVATDILFWQTCFLAPNGFDLPVSIVGNCKEIVIKGTFDKVNTCCKKLDVILYLFCRSDNRYAERLRVAHIQLAHE